MNDEAEVMEPEAEAPEVNPIESMIDNIFAKNFAGAQTTFNDLVGDKMTAALDAEKIALAQQVYNGVEPDEEQLELDLEDDVEEEETPEDGAEEFTDETPGFTGDEEPEVED